MSRLLKTSALCGLLCLSSIGIVFGSAKHTKKSGQASNVLSVNKKEKTKTVSRKEDKKSRKNVKSLSTDISLENIASNADVDSNYWDSTQVTSNSGSQSIEDLNTQFAQLSIDQGQVNIQHSRLYLAQARTSDSDQLSNGSDRHSVLIPIRPQLGAVPSFSCDDLLALANDTNQAAQRRSSESSHRGPITFQIPEKMLHCPVAVGKFKGGNVDLKATPYSLAHQPRRGISESTSHFFGGQHAGFPQMQPRFMPPQGDKEPFPTFKPIAINLNNNGRKPFPLPENRRPSRAAYRTVRYHAPSPVPGVSSPKPINMIVSRRESLPENDLQLSVYSHATVTDEVPVDNNQRKVTQLVKNIEEWIEEELANQAEALRKLVIHCGLEAQEATISEAFDCPDEAFDDFRTICHSHKTREALGFYNYAKQGVDEIMDCVDQQVTKNVLRCLLFNDPQLKGNEQIETQVRGLVDYLAEPVVKKLTRTAFLLAMDVKDDVCECCCGVWHKPKISKETKQQILSGIGSGLKGVASLFVGDDLVQGACDLAGGVFNVIKEVCAAQLE